MTLPIQSLLHYPFTDISNDKTTLHLTVGKGLTTKNTVTSCAHTRGNLRTNRCTRKRLCHGKSKTTVKSLVRTRLMMSCHTYTMNE